MYSQIASLKIESFFNQLKKKAAIGHFKDVVTEEDMKASANMVFEMIQLPKYDSIRNALTEASGVVNFVTNNEYEPLIELLIKSAFPPNNNDIYNMGNEVTLPEDYFIDASAMFAGQGSISSNSSSINSLDTLLTGTPKKMTKQWLEENRITDEHLKERYSQEELDLLKESMEEYESNLRHLKESQLRRDIFSIYKKLRENEEKKQYNKENADNWIALESSEVERLKEELKNKRTLYKDKYDSIVNGYPELNIVDRFSGELSRNNDGFISWNPLEEIRRVNNELVAAHGKDPGSIERLLLIIALRIKEYRTSDPTLNKIKNNILNFLNTNGNENIAVKWLNNYGTYARLLNEFYTRAGQHGKVMIVKNIEASALVTPSTDKENSGYYWQGGNVLENFNSANIANYTRDRSEGKNIRGKRKIIIISNAPINNLSFATVIEMKVSPVDAQEAEIIVKHLLQPYAIEAKFATQIKMLADIEKKYPDAQSKEQQSQKEQEQFGIHTVLEKIKNTLGKITPEAEQKIRDNIIGLGQGAAIRAVRNAISKNAVYSKDEDGNLIGVSLKQDEIITELADITNDALSKDTPGVTKIQGKLKWNHYIYDDSTDPNDPAGNKWGSMVKSHWLRRNEAKSIRQNMLNIRRQIDDIDSKLTNGNLSLKTKQDYLVAKKTLDFNLKQLNNDYIILLKDLPHFVILYGSAGTGKSVWPEALADGFDLTVWDADLSAVKNKWVGSTGERARKLIDMVFSARDSVFLFDEIDKVLRMDQGSTGTTSAHETTSEIVALLLKAFQNRIEDLQKNNTFVVLTTNDVSQINTALTKRALGNQFKVRRCNTPENVKKYLWDFLETERAKAPDAPWISIGKNSNEMWENTINILRSLDLDSIARILSEKNLPYRAMTSMIKEACFYHTNYLLGARAYGRGETEEITGLPLTSNNLLRCAKIAHDNPEVNEDSDYGVVTTMNKNTEKVKEAMKAGLKPIIQNVVDPVTGLSKKEVVMPDEISKIMNGEYDEDEENQNSQFEVEESEIADPYDPSKVRRQVQLKRPPSGKTMEELSNEGMKELPLDEDVEDTTVEQETTNLKKEKIKSSTDYYYQHLISKGLITEKGILISKRNTNNADIKTMEKKAVITGVGKETKPFDEVEKFGVYYFSDGQLFIAPKNAQTNPQKPNGL